MIPLPTPEDLVRDALDEYELPASRSPRPWIRRCVAAEAENARLLSADLGAMQVSIDGLTAGVGRLGVENAELRERIAAEKRGSAACSWHQTSDPECPSCNPQLILQAEIKRLQAMADAFAEETQRLKNAYSEQAREIEQTLGKALGYLPLGARARPDGNQECCAMDADGAVASGQVCVGDHVPETLAAEAAKEIERLRIELATIAKWCSELMDDAKGSAIELVRQLVNHQAKLIVEEEAESEKLRGHLRVVLALIRPERWGGI